MKVWEALEGKFSKESTAEHCFVDSSKDADNIDVQVAAEKAKTD